MKKILVFGLFCLYLILISAFGQPAPTTMTKIVVRLQRPDVPSNTFAAQPKTIYRAGSRYCRIEEVPDPEHDIHGLVVINEPDLWIVNLAKNTARHLTDPGPAFNCRLPIFNTDPAEPLRKLEFGQELAYFKEKGITPIPGPTLFDKPTKVYEIDGTDYQLLLFADSESGLPIAIKKGHEADWEIYLYSNYQEIPFDAKLFAKPENVKIEEAK